MVGFPGLDFDLEGKAAFVPEKCRDTIDALLALKVDELILLVEDDELDTEISDQLKSMADAAGLEVVHRPIVDTKTPDDTLMAWWRSTKAHRQETLSRGGTLAFVCHYGAGRSGMMAALCLIEAGLKAEAAMALVREHFDEALDSRAQREFLLR